MQSGAICRQPSVEAGAHVLVVATESNGDLAERQSLHEAELDNLAILVVDEPIEGRTNTLDLFVSRGAGAGGGVGSLGVRATPRSSGFVGRSGVESTEPAGGPAVSGPSVADGVHAESPHDLEQPGAEHRQGLRVVVVPASGSLELVKRLPGPQPGSLGQVGRALVGPLGVGEAVRGLPEPGPYGLEQRLDRRTIALLCTDDQVVETVGVVHVPHYRRHGRGGGDRKILSPYLTIKRPVGGTRIVQMGKSTAV